MRTTLLILALALGRAAGLSAAAPDAPQGLTAAATGLSGQVQLSWQPVTAPAAVTGYHVFHNSVSSLTGALDFYVTGTSAVVTGLADRVPRWFFVASDEAGVGPGPTGTAAVATPYQPPDAPVMTVQALSYSSRVLLGWDQPSTYGTQLGAVRVQAFSGGITSTVGAYPPGTLDAELAVGCGGVISFTARALDLFGSSSAASAPVPIALPCPPTAAAGPVGGGSWQVAWFAGAGPAPAAWELRSATAPGLADPLPTLVTVVAGTALGAGVPLPPQGQGLWVRAYAVSAGGLTSAASNEVALLQAPTDLTATPSKARVRLQWSAPSMNLTQGVTAYQVHYATYPHGGYGDVGASVSIVAAAAGTLQAVTLTGLADGADHWFTVAAQGGSGPSQVGASSLTVQARTGLPSPVFSAATALSSSALSFAWTAVDTAPSTPAAYHLHRSFNADLSAAVLLTVTSGLAVTGVAAPAPGSVAWYFLTVTDSAGAASAASPPAQARLRLPALQAPVLSLAATGNARVSLRWDPVPEAGRYQVYRSTQAGGGFGALLGGQVEALEFVDVAPVNGTPNYYLVHAQVPVGLGSAVHSSEASNAVTALPGVLPGVPGRYATTAQGVDLAHLTAVARGAGGVDLAWTAAAAGSSAISAYQVWRGYAAAALSQVASVTATSYADPAAPLPIQALFYGVRAVDKAGRIGPMVTGTVGQPQAWPAPSSLTAQVLAGGVRLNWSPPGVQGTYPLSAYAVSRRWQVGGPYDLLATLTGTAYVDLAPDTAQGNQPSYQVRIVDAAGGSGVAATAGVTLAPAAPVSGAPTAVSGALARPLAQAGTPVQLSWRPNPQAEAVLGYRVWRDAVELTVTAGLGHLDTPGLGSAPVYRVQAINAQGDGVSGTAQPAPIFVAPPQPQWVSVVAQVEPGREGGALGLRLAWQDLGAPVDVDAYQVWAQTGAWSGLGSATFLTETAATSFEDLLLSPTAQVSYAVLARSGAHATASPTAQLALAVPPEPGSLSGLSAVARSDGAWLGWAPSSAAVEYWVFRSTAALPAHPPVGLRLTRTAATSFVDASAPGGGDLHYAIAPVNSLGRGMAVTTTVQPLGGAPAWLSATAGFDGVPQVQLQWGAPSSPQTATAYLVWRATSAAAVLAGSGDLLTYTAASTYTDAVPLSNTAYHYAVAGVDLVAGPPKAVGPVRAYQPPSAPLAALARGGQGAVDLSWSPAPAHEGVTGWALNLEVDGVPSTLTLPASLASHRVTGLGPGTQVTFSAQALNSAGASPSSLSAFARANAAGAAPQPLSVKAQAGFAASLSWQARVLLSWSAPGAGSVLVYRAAAPLPLSLASGGPASPIYLTGLSGAVGGLTDTVDALGQALGYAVSAVSLDGLPGGESAAVAAPSVRAYRPPGLTGLSATAGDGRVDLRWGPPAEPGTFGLAASPYRLHRRTGGLAPAFAGLVEDAGFPKDLSGNAYADTDVVNGQSYWYFLSVRDAAGEPALAASYPRDANGAHAPMQPQGPPRPPATLVAVAGDSTVSLRWVAPQSAAVSGALYSVYRRTLDGDFGGPLPWMHRVGPSVTDFVNVTQVVLTLRDEPLSVSPPVNTVTYAYAVSAVNAWGEGPKSLEVLATPFKPLDPGEAGPGGRLLSLTVLDSKDVALSWGVTPGQNGNGGYALAGYRVYRSQDGGATYSLLADLTSTAYVDLETAYGAAYTYRVVPVDAMGNEGYSYALQTVVIPAAGDSIMLFRNAFNPALGQRLPFQFGLRRPGRVWVKVFTLNGDHVATLFEGEVASASEETPFLSQRLEWDGRNRFGQVVASGVYLVHMEGPGFRQNARVAVIK